MRQQQHPCLLSLLDCGGGSCRAGGSHLAAHTTLRVSKPIDGGYRYAICMVDASHQRGTALRRDLSEVVGDPIKVDLMVVPVYNLLSNGQLLTIKIFCSLEL